MKDFPHHLLPEERHLVLQRIHQQYKHYISLHSLNSPEVQSCKPSRVLTASRKALTVHNLAQTYEAIRKVYNVYQSVR